MTEIAGSLRGMQDRFQTGIKQTSSSFALQALRLVSGSVLGFTVGLVVQEVLGQPNDITLAFVFSYLTVLGAFWRVSRGWGFPTLLVFDLIAALVGLLLRLYVMVAPGA